MPFPVTKRRPQSDPIKVRVLARIAQRNHQIRVNANSAVIASLTDGELAAVIPNAALLDQRNLLDLTPRDLSIRPDPVGLTDLTNEVNEPSTRVLYHPTLSLFADLSQALRTRNAPLQLCIETDEISALLQERYIRQCKTHGCDSQWPEFRKDWEADMAKRGLMDPKLYHLQRPRPGCSPEFILDRIARDQGLVPEFDLLDRTIVTGELISARISKEDLAAEVDARIEANKRQLDAQFAQWEAFCTEAEDSFRKCVDEPLKQRARVWYYATKDLSATEMQRVLGFGRMVTEFAHESRLSKTEQMVLRSAAQTATACVVGATTPEKVIRFGVGAAERSGKALAAVAVDRTLEAVEDSAAEIGAGALKGAIAAAGVAGVPFLGPLALIASEVAARIITPIVSHRVEDATNHAFSKVAGWARTRLQNAVYEQERANTLDLVARARIEEASITDLPTRELVDDLTPVGLRAAQILVRAYEHVTPERVEKVVDYMSDAEDPLSRLGNVAAALDARRGAHFEEPIGLEFDFGGSDEENAHAGRMVLAALVECGLDVTGTVNEKQWVKGADRLRNSMNNALSLRAHIEAKSGNADMKPEEVASDHLMRVIDSSVKEMLYPNGNDFLFTGKAVSSLLQLSRHHYKAHIGRKPPRPGDTVDYAVLSVVNSAAGSGEASLRSVKQDIEAVATFMHPPSSRSSTAPAESDEVPDVN